MATVPVYDQDIYCDAALLDPYPHYAALRDLGTLVYLPYHGIYAVPRYAEVKKTLLSHKQFISSKGVGGASMPEGLSVASTLTTDGAMHAKLRAIIAEPLMPAALMRLTNEIEIAANDLIKHLVARNGFDGMADFARFLPVTIVSSLVGLPEHGRKHMLDWAAAAFDLMGVGNARAAAAGERIGEMIYYIRTQCLPNTVTPGGWAAQIWDAVDEGRITPQEAGALQVDILAPALDTTIFATGNLLNLLGRNPDQWRRLKQDASLIPQAIDEALRLESPIRQFGRVASGDQDVGGHTVPDGARVLVMYASANRDERRFEDPTRFWIERPGVSGHLAFGQGRHSCAGMHLAKLEIRALLKAMLTHVDRIEVGTPEFGLNNTLRGFAALPAKFLAAA